MQQFEIVLKDLVGLNDIEWVAIASKLKRHNVKAKSQLVKVGGLATHFYFVKSGLLRTYYLENGKEINTKFSSEGQFISSFASFITQTHSQLCLEAIEDSILFSLSFSALNDLTEESPKYEKLRRMIAEENYLCAFNRNLLMQTKTAKEKYLNFLKGKDKNIADRVPQHQIATFLGIAPESLSRIKKEIGVL